MRLPIPSRPALECDPREKCGVFPSAQKGGHRLIRRRRCLGAISRLPTEQGPHRAAHGSYRPVPLVDPAPPASNLALEALPPIARCHRLQPTLEDSEGHSKGHALLRKEPLCEAPRERHEVNGALLV